MSTEGMSWSERLAKIEAEKAARKQAEQPAPEVASPAAPAPAQLPADGVLTTFEVSAPEPVKTADNDLDTFIREMKILDVYRDFVGKMTPTVLPGQVESIMISCPSITHPDNHPSAWVNIETNLWHCMGCNRGGDTLEMIASAWGWDDYKGGANPKRFHDMRREIAKRYGWVIENQNGFEVALSPKAIEERNKKFLEQYAQPAQAQPEHMVSLSPIEMGSSTATMPPLAPVISIATGEEVEEEEPYNPNDFEINRGLPILNWKSVVKEGTFLDEYMKEAIVDYAPEEYHFFNALTALALAVGRNAYTKEFAPLYSNIYVCAIGETSIGKSSANYALNKTITKALEWRQDDITRQGILNLPTPASGEVLIRTFKGTIKTKIGETNTGRVKGLIYFDEMSEFVSRASRQSSILKDIVLRLYNTPNDITNKSLTGGEDIAVAPFCCFSTSVQPGVIRKLMTKDDSASGFLNRFFFVTGRYKKQPGIKKHAVEMDKAASLLKGINLWSQGPMGPEGYPLGIGQLVTDLAAEAKYNDWHDNVFEPTKTKSSSSEIEKRMDMVVKKLAMLFAFNDMSNSVTEEHYEMAFSILPFMRACSKIVDDKVNLSMGGEMEKDILDIIHTEQEKAKKKATDAGKPFNPKWITAKFIKDKRRKYESQDIIKCLETLKQLGVLHGQNNPPRNGPGKPIIGMAYIPAESA